MIFISHRGNIDGVIAERENSPRYIEECLKKGFHCEIDLRMKDGVPHLGHDTADYPVSTELLRDSRLWIHVKEYEALTWVKQNCPTAKYFCHESDRYTLISNGMIWSHDLNNKMNTFCIIPLLSKEQVESYNQTGFGGVCSDYINDCVRKFS